MLCTLNQATYGDIELNNCVFKGGHSAAIRGGIYSRAG